MKNTITIDGSYGEGGGQILRSATALSAITGSPIHVINIRANRRNPGLAHQHATAIRCIKELTHATVSALDVGTRTLDFQPGTIHGGRYAFDIGTAGSIPLVFQTLIPVCLFADSSVEATLTGGTDVRFSPGIDYLRHVFLPFLQKMGAIVELDLLQRGYYPKGGGKVVLRTEPAPKLHELRLDSQGTLQHLYGKIHCSLLPGHISDRMSATAQKRLDAFIHSIQTCSSVPVRGHGSGIRTPVGIDIAVEDLTANHPIRQSLSPGTGITLWAETATTILGADSLGERGISAEQVAMRATDALMQELDSGATVDVHAADMLLLYLALAGGRYRTREITNHTRTGCWLVERFTDKAFEIGKGEAGIGVWIDYH